MDTPLDEQYLTWLYGQVASVKLKNPSRTHWKLLNQLYRKEFVWFVPNDDNRVADGLDIRREFLQANQMDVHDPLWWDLGCSMLEMMVALSRRLSFDGEGEPRVWFWHMIETVDLYKYNDRAYNDEAERVIEETLDRIIWRRYASDGQGGLFPLRNPPSNQRDVELWYQASAYLVELF